MAFITVFMSSCREDVQFPIIPAVEFKSLEMIPDTIYITFDMTDGDGNFGLNEEDTLGNFLQSADPFNKYHYCIFGDPYILNNGVWEYVDVLPNAMDEGSPFYYRTNRRLDPTGADKNLEAEIQIEVVTNVLSVADFPPGDTLKFEIHIADRDLQESNIVETPAFIIP